VRFAFAAKGVAAEYVAINLLEGGSESAEHLARNPMGYVPVLEFLDHAGGDRKPRYLGESLAIIEWAEEAYRAHPLLPSDLILKGRARQLAELINAGTQPLINLGVGARHSADEAEQKAWNQHWIKKGLAAYEELARETAGKFSIGDSLTLADICLIPQGYSAARNGVTLDEYPTIGRIHAECAKLASYQSSHPDRFKPA
jgi:maleylpyruvate isomerase